MTHREGAGQKSGIKYYVLFEWQKGERREKKVQNVEKTFFVLFHVQIFFLQINFAMIFYLSSKT